MEIPVTVYYLTPLVFAFAVLLICSVYYSFVRVAKPRNARANIYRCVVCKYVYLDERKVPLSRCGKCGCLNESIKR